MGRRAIAGWHAGNRCWRSCAKVPGTTRPQTIYLKEIPYGPVGSPNWHQAQEALAAYLASVGRTAAPYPGGDRRRSEPVAPSAPSRSAIRAEAERIRARRLRRMGDGRGHLDSTALGCSAPRSFHGEVGPRSAAQACAAMLRDWKRRAGLPA